MMHAYDKIYLDKACFALGRMLDFAVYELQYDITEFFEMFLELDMAERFEKGDVSVIVGRSGVELAYEIMEKHHKDISGIRVKYAVDRSKEYWTGWALAYYQWQSALSFSEIIRCIPIKDVTALYTPYHEMDIRQFVDKMNELYRKVNSDTNLKRIRISRGYSQRELAELSGIPVRTIQQYEQRQKNINKASVMYLRNISKVLYCEIEDLIELVE